MRSLGHQLAPPWETDRNDGDWEAASSGEDEEDMEDNGKCVGSGSIWSDEDSESATISEVSDES